MTITSKMSLENFEAWSGAVDTLNKIENEGKRDMLENMLEDLFPDGMTDTELNDLLWFESDMVYGWLDIRTYEQIKLDEAKEELCETKEELEDLIAEYLDSCIGIADWERKEIWVDDYKSDAKILKEEIARLKDEIAVLEEELEEF